MRVTRIFRANQRSRSKIVINRGGTRSSKTYSIVQLAALWLVTGRIEATDPEERAGVWTILRRSLPALKGSAYRDFNEILHEMGVHGFIFQNKTDMLYQYGGRTVEFMSLDDEQKIRSRKRTYLHVVESNEINFDEFIQLLIRTKRRIYLDFNPDDPTTWVRTELEDKRALIKGDVETIVSTYKDNPYLTRDEIEEIQYLESVDPELWKVFGTGEYGETRGLIYQPPTIIASMPELEVVYGGLDWGFSQDPTAVVLVGKYGGELYVDEVLYERRLVNTEIAQRLPKGRLYVADSADPKSIEDLSRLGVRIIPSLKGPDSVRQGINRVREFKLNVTARSVNLLKELRNYKYTPDGDPVDAFNHALDALRYVVQTKLKHNNEVGHSSRVSGYDNPFAQRAGTGRMV